MTVWSRPEELPKSLLMQNVISSLDKDLQPIAVGDAVEFSLMGFIEQQVQAGIGKIIEIDTWGGITIEVEGEFSHRTSSGAIALKTDRIYFVHHVYDSAKRARVYASDACFITKAA